MCKYCEQGQSYTSFNTKTMMTCISQKDNSGCGYIHLVDETGNTTVSPEISYCPMCGRKLGTYNVLNNTHTTVSDDALYALNKVLDDSADGKTIKLECWSLLDKALCGRQATDFADLVREVWDVAYTYGYYDGQNE